MRRRSFLAGAVAAPLSLAAIRSAKPAQGGAKKFKLKYAPDLDKFPAYAEDPVELIKFLADQGSRAVEDNFMKRRPVSQQEAISRELEKHGMEMGIFVASMEWRKPNFASQDAAATKKILDDLRSSVEVAKRVRAKWVTVVPGTANLRLRPGFQNAYAIDNLRRACEVCEPAGLVMVIEPLNPWHDHPGMFLSTIPQAYLLCKAVNSPSCKILFDMYHAQISEGNIIPNIDRAWDQIGYFQIGDNPGRKEPTTGEMNYKNIFKHIHAKGYEGILGMEHGKSKKGKEGELAVIAAYRYCDSFSSD